MWKRLNNQQSSSYTTTKIRIFRRGVVWFISLSYASVAGFSATFLAPMDPVGAVMVVLATSTW